jgi:hypothetical protein
MKNIKKLQLSFIFQLLVTITLILGCLKEPYSQDNTDLIGKRACYTQQIEYTHFLEKLKDKPYILEVDEDILKNIFKDHKNYRFVIKVLNTPDKLRKIGPIKKNKYLSRKSKFFCLDLTEYIINYYSTVRPVLFKIKGPEKTSFKIGKPKKKMKPEYWEDE